MALSSVVCIPAIAAVQWMKTEGTFREVSWVFVNIHCTDARLKRRKFAAHSRIEVYSLLFVPRSESELLKSRLTSLPKDAFMD